MILGSEERNSEEVFRDFFSEVSSQSKKTPISMITNEYKKIRFARSSSVFWVLFEKAVRFF